jgi:hypothetical protein
MSALTKTGETFRPETGKTLKDFYLQMELDGSPAIP